MLKKMFIKNHGWNYLKLLYFDMLKYFFPLRNFLGIWMELIEEFKAVGEDLELIDVGI